MVSAELSRRVGRVAGYPPICEMSPEQRREFHKALLDAETLEDLPGKWQAAVLKAEQNRPYLRVVGRRLIGEAGGVPGCPLLLEPGLEGHVVPAVLNGVLDELLDRNSDGSIEDRRSERRMLGEMASPATTLPRAMRRWTPCG
jgi:hypothetical protein